MSEMYKIVSESVEEIQNDMLTPEKIQEQVNDAYDVNGELDFNKLFTVIMRISTAASNNVLLTTLEKLQNEGYLSKD
ncbi:hypothetical protein BU586_11165 [Staphylococcus agnetis]|uniref:hypothetical protein n=1 Tax=Staphylococcus TaxID=1279 RepID=UPI000D19A059|nr:MULTISPECIES: hypothetical protein [Staphylococcus]MCO4357969.1 hypothetical protein [Staphylococcus agnetis]MCO4363321.1 hypothetical protein [Staphylococcus agnetis]NHM74099.1 hypothetical protein [Staphylococcus sp. 11007852]NJH79276.1 hypothetical protein [Staphylococcus agnetis]NJH83764.1 hypothetical protein [Staphylococcus agnetis]